MRYRVLKKQQNSKMCLVCGKDSKRIFEGTGEILLSDGDVAVEGHGKYIKLPLSKIADFDANEQEWRVVSSPNDPEIVEFSITIKNVY